MVGVQLQPVNFPRAAGALFLHSFCDEEGPDYDPPSAALTWSRVTDFLKVVP